MSHITIVRAALIQTLVSFVNVFFRSFQQLNVMQADYLLMTPTSYMQGLCFVLTTIITVDIGLSIYRQTVNVLAMGTGGAVGAMGATYIHGDFF